MTDPGYIRSLAPLQIRRGGKLPEPLPAGQLPPDDNRLWLFTPACIQKGEQFIQPDTIEWYREKNGEIMICRSYPDHPRWTVVGGKDRMTKARSDMANAGVISEVHLLARRMRGLADFPDWVPAVMSLKQQQADVSWRLTRATRKVWLQHGEDAMRTFAQRAPGQFVKFVAATFIPKKLEADVRTGPALGGADPETLAAMAEAFENELKRRQEEAKVDRDANLIDYEPGTDIGAMVLDKADEFKTAAAVKSAAYGAMLDPRESTHRLQQVRDISDPLVEEIENAEVELDDGFWG